MSTTFSLKTILNRLEGRRKTRALEKLERLKKKLQEFGYGADVIRDDSRLVASYITDRMNAYENNVIFVANKIVETIRLYRETKYREISEQIVSLLQKEIMESSGLETGETTAIVLRHMIPAIRQVYTEAQQVVNYKANIENDRIVQGIE
jgi:hypothetical protein